MAKMFKIEKYVIVGREELPVETSMSVDNVQHALMCVEAFLPGGSMWRDGDKGKVVIYIPGTEIPLHDAHAMGIAPKVETKGCAPKGKYKDIKNCT